MSRMCWIGRFGFSLFPRWLAWQWWQPWHRWNDVHVARIGPVIVAVHFGPFLVARRRL